MDVSMDEESKSPENKSSSKQKSKSKMKSVQSDEADLQSPSSSSTAPPTGLNEATASLTMHHFLSGQFRHAGFDGAQASALREMERLTLSFVTQIFSLALDYANLANRAAPNVRDFFVACEDANLSVEDLGRVASTSTAVHTTSSSIHSPKKKRRLGDIPKAMAFIPPPPAPTPPVFLPSDSEEEESPAAKKKRSEKKSREKEKQKEKGKGKEKEKDKEKDKDKDKETNKDKDKEKEKDLENEKEKMRERERERENSLKKKLASGLPRTLSSLPPQFPPLPPKHTYLWTPPSPPKTRSLPSLDLKISNAKLIQESLGKLIQNTEAYPPPNLPTSIPEWALTKTLAANGNAGAGEREQNQRDRDTSGLVTLEKSGYGGVVNWELSAGLSGDPRFGNGEKRASKAKPLRWTV